MARDKPDIKTINVILISGFFRILRLEKNVVFQWTHVR